MDERTTESSGPEKRESQDAEIAQRAARLAALGQLARGVAHDFANFLMVIAGHAELGIAQLGENEPLRRSLEQIQRAAQQANDLCGELAAFAGRTPLTLKPTNLTEEIERIIADVSRALPDGIRIEDQLPRGLPPIEANRARLEELVAQLVSNAADAMSEKPGTITLRSGIMTADRKWLDLAVLGERLEPDEYVFLEVADAGSGMDEATALRMFDPFFTTRRKGRGLGLSRVLGIVRAHGGAIHVATRPDQGTTIRVLFPRGAALSETSREALRKLLEG